MAKNKEQSGTILPVGYQSRLIASYREQVIPELMKQFGYKNVMQVPKLEKIVLNMGSSDGSRDAKLMEKLRETMDTIAGQKSLITKAKIAVSNFKIRQGMGVGCSVTLRKNRMYDFLDRFINISVPRIRDFRGLNPKSFDGRGNYALGVKEQLIFPEIDYDSIPKVQGMDVCIVTTAKTDEEGRALLTQLGMPFRK